MATALYRLGRWCARHAWRVVAAWLVVLGVVAAGAATLGTPLTSAVSIPGSDFQRVLDSLGRKIPEASGGVATVVFRSDSGEFTPAQQQAVRGVLDEWSALPQVKSVVDPFAQQQRLDEGAAALEEAGTTLADAKAQLADGRARLDAAQGQLAFARSVLADLEASSPTDPQIPVLRAQIRGGAATLADKEAEYAAGARKLARGEARYAAGQAQQGMLNGLRFVTADGGVAYSQIQFETNAQSVPPEVREQIRTLGAPLAEAGVRTDYSVEITQAISVVGPGEVAGLVLAGIVLVGMLGTLVAAGLPLAVALLGVGVGLLAAVTTTWFYEMNSITPALALMIGLAVGIDYALFIVNRHRNQILRGTPLEESIGRAVGTAGNAVIFAGSTVVIALAALVVSGIRILGQLGLVAAGTVAVTVAVAVTLSPAVLALMGTRVVSRRAWRTAGFTTPGDPATRTAHDDREEEHGGWYVTLLTRRPWLTVLAVVAVVGLLALPARDLRLGLPDGSSEPPDSTAFAAYQTVAEEFGPGVNGPLVAVVTLPEGTSAAQAAATQVEVGTQLSRLYRVRHVVPFGQSADHTMLAFQVVLDSGPSEQRTVEAVQVIKDSLPQLGRSTGATIELTGQTVANIEISQRLADALPLYLLLVVGLSLLILTVVFRSLVVPLVATGGFLLSVAAAFGATVAVYQWGWLGSVLAVPHPGPLLSFMPIILIGVLFGLAMDYQMFLVSGMREAYAHGAEPRTAVRTGFVHGAKVVTAAAVIMASVFGGFVFAELTMVRAIGFGLAVGVLVDAVLVRMTLTPALMHLMGRHAWWIPAWLDRRLPDLDLEGTGLTAHLAERDARAAQRERATLGS
ncbi:MAG TPA: MMPL family transporter [Nocardioides sp.]|uniref:MMPL family transporter n=1 Tax=Nocardioides sp. TaxID=35761 RepID=UPI002D1D2FF5|nr:MMPL family transporter [Nocardioides sp.]HQR27940.1 MMPL family transporter [Nocardioides sp.]